MAEFCIGQGTTPTLRLRYPFSEEQTDALLITVRQNGKNILSKEKPDVSWSEGRLIMTLSQIETLQLTPGAFFVQMRARLQNGVTVMLNGKDPIPVVEAFEKKVI